MVAVLGAGRSSRYGTAKLDQHCAGKALGAWAVETALGWGGETVLVARDPAPRFAGDFGNRLYILVNGEADAGLGTSVALAARHAIACGAPYLLLMLADMPLVTGDVLDRLAADCPDGGASACRHDGGQPGIPAAWSAASLPMLAAIPPERGAKALLRQVEPLRLIDTPATMLSDVDVPADLGAVEIALAASIQR